MQDATPKFGAVGAKWRERPTRGSRTVEILSRAGSSARTFKVYDPATPGYVTREVIEAAWLCKVTYGEDGRVAGRKVKSSTIGKPRTTVIRDDVLGRLWVKVS